MPEIRDLVDVETLLVAHLGADVDLAAEIGDRVSSPDLPADFKAEKRVRLFRVSGVAIDEDTGQIDRAGVQFDCYGADALEALVVAKKTITAVLRAPGAAHDGAVVTKAVRSLGPVWSPDPEGDVPRYMVGAIITLHPTDG